MNDTVDIKEIVRTLIEDHQPIKRDKIAAGIQRHYEQDLGRAVSRETIKRAIRYAINRLLDEDGILVDWGPDGYFIVDDPKGRRSAEKKCRMAANALHERANRIRGTAVSGEPVQRDLDDWPDPHAYPCKDCGE